MHLTIFDKVRAMLVDSKIDKRYLTEAADTAIHVYNRTSHSANQGGRTPFECFLGRKPDISHLRPFGDVAMVLTLPKSSIEGKSWVL
jgi:hypothetical protein